MTTGVPWSVKGIDRKARETAKDLARRSGLTLGEWLNQMIEEHEPEEPVYRDAPYQQGYAPGYAPGHAPANIAEAIERLSARIEAAETRSTLAITGIDQSVRGLVSRIEMADREQTAVAARFEGGLESMASSHAKFADRLRKVEDEAAGPRAVEAVHALEGSLAKLANHIYDSEGGTRDGLAQVREEVAELAKRLEANESGAVGMIDTVVGGIGERIERAEGRTNSALKGLENSFGQLDRRLSTAEAKLATTPDIAAAEQKLEALAATLTDRVEASRKDMAEKLHAAADGRFDRMDRALQEMTGHVQEAERRSAQALERMGHEVLRMAESLGRRMESVEHRAADAIEHVSTDVARIGEHLDSRLQRADGAQAAALEKLGGEIARITERLSERIANAERRSAQAIDDVGEQMSRVSDRLNQQYERSTGDLAERIQKSEERTARLLEDAREKIDQRLAEGQRRFADAGIAPGMAVEAVPFTPDPYAAPFGQAYVAASVAPPPTIYPDPHAIAGEDFSFAPPAFEPVRADEPASELADISNQAEPLVLDTTLPIAAEALASYAEVADPFDADLTDSDFDAPKFEPTTAFDEAKFEAATGFDEQIFDPADLEAPIFEQAATAEPRHEHDFAPGLSALAHEDLEDGAPHADPLSLDDTPRTLTTREIIEQARAAAREAQEKTRGRAAAPASQPMGGGGVAGIGFVANRRKSGSKLKAGLFASVAVLVSLGTAVVGLNILKDQPAPGRGVDADLQRPTVLPDAAPPIDQQPRAAVLLDPQLITPAAPAAPVTAAPAPILAPPILAPAAVTPPVVSKPAAAPVITAKSSTKPAALAAKPATAAKAVAPAVAAAAPAADPVALYNEGVRRIEAKDNGGLEPLRKAANLGYPPAQLQLGRVYELGQAGVTKNLVEARRWTERAAEAGLPKAMHNLAMYYVGGEGGAKNLTTASQWFRRAADAGLVDSQYNLGLLYEQGIGVGQNSAEAYKWFLVATRGGDDKSKGEARAAAARVKSQLSVEAQAAAEKSANAPATALAASSTPQTADGGDIGLAQKALGRLGYYKGPQDGTVNSNTRLAILAYQRDQGIPTTGNLDPLTSTRLAPYGR